jgi:catechol 2,3-dioxygenase-like lactoylglutathione lyase family enzyme
MIIADADAQPTVAVRDMDRARAFYGGLLGLKPAGPEMEAVQAYHAGHTVIVVYESQFAGTNQGTSITWPLGRRFDQAVAELHQKGVHFEHYDIPGASRAGDVHQVGGMRLAWFKDPDGNIIHIGNFGR